MSESTEEQTLADSICKQLSETLTGWDAERLNSTNKQNKYLSDNIEAILQGNKDIKKNTENIESRMVDIEKLVCLHDTAINKLTRYASIENTAIRIFLAVIIAVAFAVAIHKLIW